jgi:hypothetical protein
VAWICVSVFLPLIDFGHRVPCRWSQTARLAPPRVFGAVNLAFRVSRFSAAGAPCEGLSRRGRCVAGASSRFLRPQVRCPILRFARSSSASVLVQPCRLAEFFCAASSSRFCFPSSSQGARRQALSHPHCRASVLEYGQHFPSFTAHHRHAVQHLSEIPPHLVAVVRSISPKVNLGLVLLFRRWFLLNPVLHKRRRFFAQGVVSCPGILTRVFFWV